MLPQQQFSPQQLPQQGVPQQFSPQQLPQQGSPQPQQVVYTQPGYPQAVPQQVIYAQPQPVFMMQQPLEQPAKILSGFERINKDGVFIKQKIDIAEVASGCERENSYSIFNMDKGAQKTGVELLRAREKSSWCARQVLSGGCRPFFVNIQLRDNDAKTHNAPFLELERPCTCTCLCFARPVVNVHHVENGKRTYLGKLVQPFKCNCDLNLEVYDSVNQLQYKLRAGCCQTGVYCGKNPCQSCQTVDFPIQTVGGLTVSSIQKKTAGCCASMVSTADNYAVSFPNNATVETKALLISAALFIDYLWFERGGI